MATDEEPAEAAPEAETLSEAPETDSGGEEAGEEEPRMGAEENPTIEPVDDPEKAFGYEE